MGNPGVNSDPQASMISDDQDSGGIAGTDVPALLPLLDGNDPGALSTYFRTADPCTMFDAATDGLRERLAEVPAEIAASVPELDAMRAVALVWSDNAREEVPAQLRETILRMLAEQRAAWAAEAAIRWMYMLSVIEEPLDASTASARLLELHPELIDLDPFTGALAAGLASRVGRRDAATRLWESSLAALATHPSADVRWRVQMEWATEELGPAQGQLSQAQLVLRRARNHFAGRNTTSSLASAHFASLNLADVMIRRGLASEALTELARDERMFSPHSLEVAYLHAHMALASADVGDSAACKAHLARAAAVPRNDAITLLGVVGPARVLAAGLDERADDLDVAVADLLRAEHERPAPVDKHVFWRISAAKAYATLGNQAQARWYADEAASLCADAALPYMQAWARLLRLPHLDAQEQAAESSELVAWADEYELVDLVTQREPELGCLAMWHAVASNGSASPFVRRCLTIVGQRTSDRTLGDWPDLAVWNSPAVAELRAELGWNNNAFSGVNRPSDAGLRVELLGALRVFDGDEDITLSRIWQGRRKARILLARLLVMRGGTESSEDLAHILWPDGDPDRSHRNLARVVHALRKVLNHFPDSDRSGELMLGPGGYELVLGAGASCDLIEFEEAAAEALAVTDERALDAAERAYRLYRGDFLAGEGYDQWIEEQRFRLADMFQRVVLHEGEVRSTAGGIGPAAERLQHILEDDPSCEEACRLLMSWHASRGEISRVNDLYHELNLTVRGLGLRPSAETRDLYAELIS